MLVYDLARHEAHCLGETAMLVWCACDGTKSIAALAGLLPKSLEPATAEALVEAVLYELERLELIEARPKSALGLSRQQLLRRLGVAVVAIPLVTSLDVPEPAAAVSCGTTGAPCTIGSDCCSGICLGLVCA